MTLQDYIKVFRHRWPVILICALVAGAVTWFITPASADTTKKIGSYNATATIVVGSKDPEAGGANLGRIALYLTTGEVPKRAAAAVKFDGDPALLAAGLTVGQDSSSASLTVTATASDGDRAAAVANAFANQIVKYISEAKRPGAENATLQVLQSATPIPNAAADGGFVVPPGRGPRTAIATLLGFLVGLGAALVMDRLDSRLRTRADVHSALRMPIIAEVPRLKRSQRNKATLGVLEDPLSLYADGYRAARTALTHTAGQVMPGDYSPRRSAIEPRRPVNSARLVLITSAHASEGKTTSVANLAASFAETGQQVLVLDADLRSPDVHNAFDVPQGAGISDYLTDPGEGNLHAVVRPTSVPGVRIITAGTSLAHPASLASRMGHLLEEAREMADVVLIDTAPLLEASDVFDILPMVDTLLLVVRHGRLTEVAGNRVAELVGRFQVPVSGVIIVGAKAKLGDTYGYGYGDARKTKKKVKRGRKLAEQRRPAAPLVTDSEPDDLLDDLMDNPSRDEASRDSRRTRRASSA